MEKHVYLTVYSEYLHECKSYPLPRFNFCQVCRVLKNLFTKNCAVGKVSSSLVSVKTRISICCITISFNCSNLFGGEFMLRLPTIILFGFLILSFLISNNRFGEVS